MYVAIATAIVAAVVVGRSIIGWRVERWVGARHPVGPDGVIVGAGTIDLPALPGAPRGAVLAIHGFGDTPQTLAYVAQALARAGWAVRAPLLPGHGRSLSAFARSSATDWIGAVRHEYASLRAQHHHVVVLGLSMGGALATILAAETPDLPALVLIAPYLAMPGTIRLAGRIAPLLTVFTRYMRGRGGRSIRDPAEAARNLAYGVTTPRLLRELRAVVDAATLAAPAVRAPTLVVQSHHDNRIASAAATAAFATLGAADKQIVWVDDGAHIITVDTGRDLVIEKVADWLATR